MRTLPCLCLVLSLATIIRADGLGDNDPKNVRPVPPVGIELTAADRQQLESGLAELQGLIDGLKQSKQEFTLSLLPDVEIYARAIRDGVAHRELFAAAHVKSAHAVLAEGIARAQALARGEAPWTRATGLVVRGFRSRIDDTVQPYGLVVPETYSFGDATKHRLDLWLHGRGERSSEVVFIHERMTRTGRIAPPDTIVLHPYGRYSNAFKFAGEIDVLEALQHARGHYRVDDNRVSIRGFSMGGAGCWQFAVHYPGLFFAANPGAGFSETPEFLRSFQKETLTPTWFEKKLWTLYDCPGYAENLRNLPTVAYSGELDIQKQAADVMEQTLRDRNMRLTHLIGPKTKHAIDPQSMKTIESKLAAIAELGRNRVPPVLRFTTYTLRYDESHWLKITGMREHWSQASVWAMIDSERPLKGLLLRTHGVTEIELNFPAGHAPFDLQRSVELRLIDVDHLGRTPAGAQATTQTVRVDSPETDRSLHAVIHRDGDAWKVGPRPNVGLRKRHGLQGPIDDAFMDRFIVVAPSGTASSPAVDHWTRSEMDHLVREWRRQFRGDAIVKLDRDISAEDIASSNLILFGDPKSNSVIGRVMDKLPVDWNASQVKIGSDSFQATNHAPVMIYPNPLNADRYIVLNSGFTYREYAYLNNARQVPKLPDWAIINLDTPPDSLWPGKVVAADFFDERWQVK